MSVPRKQPGRTYNRHRENIQTQRRFKANAPIQPRCDLPVAGAEQRKFPRTNVEVCMTSTGRTANLSEETSHCLSLIIFIKGKLHKGSLDWSPERTLWGFSTYHIWDVSTRRERECSSVSSSSSRYRGLEDCIALAPRLDSRAALSVFERVIQQAQLVCFPKWKVCVHIEVCVPQADALTVHDSTLLQTTILPLSWYYDI